MVETVDTLCLRLFVDSVVEAGAEPPICVEVLAQTVEDEQRLKFNSVVQVSVFNEIYRISTREVPAALWNAECVVWPDGSYDFDYFEGS
jgi:hypothetical protein